MEKKKENKCAVDVQESGNLSIGEQTSDKTASTTLKIQKHNDSSEQRPSRDVITDSQRIPRDFSIKLPAGIPKCFLPVVACERIDAHH